MVNPAYVDRQATAVALHKIIDSLSLRQRQLRLRDMDIAHAGIERAAFLLSAVQLIDRSDALAWGALQEMIKAWLGAVVRDAPEGTQQGG